MILDKRNFTFAKLKGADNYKQWKRHMTVTLDRLRVLQHLKSDEENPSSVALVLFIADETNIAKVDVADRRQATVDKFYDKRYLVRGLILEMVVDSIQQELLAKKFIDKWTPYTLWEYLKNKYTIKNTASQWDIV